MLEIEKKNLVEFETKLLLTFQNHQRTETSAMSVRCLTVSL